MDADSPLERLDIDRTALLVVDVQKAFASPESPLAAAGRDLEDTISTVSRVEELLDIARDAGLTVAFTRSLRRSDRADAAANVYDILPNNAKNGDPICCAGAPDAEYVEGIEPRPDEYEVGKVRYNAFNNTPLEYYLRNERIESVLVCGFTTNVCVEGTARGAFERGFNVVIVGDCCASFSEDRHEMALRDMETILGTVTTLEEFRETTLKQQPASRN